MSEINQSKDLRGERENLGDEINNLEGIMNSLRNSLRSVRGDVRILKIIIFTVVPIVFAGLSLFYIDIKTKVVALYEQHAREEEIEKAKKHAVDAAQETEKIKNYILASSAEINNVAKEAQEVQKLNEIMPLIRCSVDEGVEICKQDGAKILKVDGTRLSI